MCVHFVLDTQRCTRLGIDLEISGWSYLKKRCIIRLGPNWAFLLRSHSLTMLFSHSGVLAPSFILLALTGNSIAIDVQTRARTSLQTLQGWYNASSGIWDTCGWWDGASCMNTVANLAALDPSVMDIATYVFTNTFNVGPVSNPHPGPETKTVFTRDTQPLTTVNASNWLNQAYDDDGWWALAWIAAYDVTKEPKYLELAEGIFASLVCIETAPFQSCSHLLTKLDQGMGN